MNDTAEATKTVEAAKTLPDRLRVTLQTKASDGEKATYNFAHWVVNFFGNYLLSAAITDLFLGASKDLKTQHQDDEPTSFLAEKFGKPGQAVSDGLYKSHRWGTKQLVAGSKAVGMSDGLATGFAKTFMNIFTLMMGGHITASIATYILNRNEKWSRQFDAIIDKVKGRTLTPEEMQAREARYTWLREQPKKGAGTVIKGRLLGMLFNNLSTFLTTLMDFRRYTPDLVKEHDLYHKDLNPEGNKDAKTGIRAVTEGFGNTISAFTRHKRPNMSEEARKRVDFWSELGLLEVFFTFNTTKALEIVMNWGKEKGSKPLAPATVEIEVPYTPEMQVAESKTNDPKKSRWADDKVSHREETQPHEIRNATKEAALATL